MNLSQLEVLVAIVDTGSLTEAGEVVGLTQSAVSYSLSRLESELGVTLLERSRQGIALTHIGEEILSDARQILTQVETIRQKTSRARGLSVGKVRFGVVPNIAPRLIMGIIRDFQHKYPDIDLVLFEGSPHELLEWLQTDVIDVGAVLVPDSHYKQTVPFAAAEIKVILPNDHVLAKSDAVLLNDLQHYALVGPRSHFGMFNNIVKDKTFTLPKLRYEVSSMSTILTMVREAMGISLMPDMLYEGNLDGIVLRPFDPPIQLRVHLATHRDLPAINAFMNNTHQWSKEHGFLE